MLSVAKEMGMAHAANTGAFCRGKTKPQRMLPLTYSLSQSESRLEGRNVSDASFVLAA